MNYEKLIAQLRIDEGVRYKRYKDTMGIWTIGVGHNIEADTYYPYTVADEPLNDKQVDALLMQDIAVVVSELDQRVNWWRAMEDVRQRVLANMCFNLGWPRLSQFKNTLKAMHDSRYAEAAQGMRNSLWYKQVGARAERLAKQMEKGA